MDGYLLDTNAASVLWDARHADHDKIRAFLESVSPAPVWISIIALAEVEYGLKTAPAMNLDTHKDVRAEMAKYPEVLEPDKHTIAPYSDLRAELFKSYAPRDRKGRLTKKWVEDLFERTSAKELHGSQENDIWVASLAIQYNLILVTEDRMAPIVEVSKYLPDPLRIQKWR
ncbi:MAG TPA: PIN domain-containing protein [Syntrophobacteraceae bacterium]|nr:PIN domain-containing protein [Syntrophobacteraceae bacterium]